MKSCAVANTFYASALLTRQQPKSKSFNPPLILNPKVSVYSFCTSAIRTSAWSHRPSNSKDFKAKAKVKAEAGDDRKLVRVKMTLQKECMFGEQFSVVGEEEGLGSWDPEGAIPMNWSPGHLWTTPLLDLPSGKMIYFKFILTDTLGEIQWQPGPDRMFETWETAATILVSLDWDSFHPQTITEEAAEEEFAETMQEAQDPIRVSTAEVDIPGTVEGRGGEVISGVPVLVPGLTKTFHADCSAEEDVGGSRNSLVSVIVAESNSEEEEEEEESSSSVKDDVDTPTNHRSFVHEEEEESSSNAKDDLDTPTNHRSFFHDQEEESSSYVKDDVDTPTNHRSLVHEEEEVSSDADLSLVHGEEEVSSDADLSHADEEEVSSATEVS